MPRGDKTKETGRPAANASAPVARAATRPDTKRKRAANTRSKKMSENQGEPSEQQVEQQSEQQRELAYYLWQQAGSPEGRQDEFWHLAGHQLAQNDLAADAAIDAAEEDSFPASDPVNHT